MSYVDIELRTLENPEQIITLDSTLSLSCDYEGFPLTVIWLHNDTKLDVSDHPRVSITYNIMLPNSTLMRSQLEITNVERENGGIYACRANNSAQLAQITVSTVIIISESKLGKSEQVGP